MMARGCRGKCARHGEGRLKRWKLQESGEVRRKVCRKRGKAAEHAVERGKVEPKRRKRQKAPETRKHEDQ